jgi:tetratricopeptide (TPR) repeat protein
LTTGGRRLLCCVLAALALGSLFTAPAAAPDTAVHVWRGTIQIPTYVEDAANPNAPFDLFSFGRFNYPYPIRDALTTRRETVSWRSLNLENEYLRVTVLPDLGGHLYSCLDKRTGREMFYANRSIKKALIGYRGAWAALGIEFNYPVSHNWMSISPVDFATVQNPDGSGSIWIGNKDLVYGGQWHVELRLTPGRSVLEEHVDLYNSSDVRHRYYWWTNAAVQVWEDSRLVYPTELMATHGFTAVEPWPIDRKGRDLSVIRNQVDGPVSLFTYKTREPFVGVYHPHTSSGTVTVADPADLPVHKVWSWGNDREAATWRTALSDDNSGYIELQSGLFRNQETYAFLEPEETVHFSESWLPVRDLGGITRANVDAVLFMDRPAPSRVALALDVTRDLPDARVRVRQGSTNLLDRTVNLSPRDVWRATVDTVSDGRVTLQVLDAAGKTVLSHTENTFDRTPASDERLGPRPDPRASRSTDTSADDVVEDGLVDELEGRRLAAMAKYRSGLERYPHSLALLKAAGRLGVALTWPDAATPASSQAIDWLEQAYIRNTTDFETRYYLGLALVGAGRSGEARPHFEAAQRFRATRAAATLQLARLFARDGRMDAALEQVRLLTDESSGPALAEALEVALLRRQGRLPEARDRARACQAIHPTSSLLRYERTLLGDADPDLWMHLGADANRVLDLVDHYLAIGDDTGALGLLDRKYPTVEPPAREVGAVSPQDSPLVAYYRAFARARAGGSTSADYALATTLPTTYVFPNRRSSYQVLAAALEARPDDATARFLLGSLYLANGLVDPAIGEWQRIRKVRPAIPTLNRNLGLALLQTGNHDEEARAVLEEGITADSRNVEVYSTLDGVLSESEASPRDRVAALRRFPAPDRMPSSMVFKLGLAMAEAGDAGPAEALFHNRYFPQEEGGTSVRTMYTQVRLVSARVASAKGDCATAREILDSLTRAQKDLPFTAGGLAEALQPPLMARQVADIDSICGRRDAARTTWQQLAKGLAGQGGPLTVAIAAEARERLGLPRTPEDRRRLEEALTSASRTLDTGGTSNPGSLEYARATLLAALGRTDEARQSIRRVFLYPDRGLAHVMARSLLSDLRAERGQQKR